MQKFDRKHSIAAGSIGVLLTSVAMTSLAADEAEGERKLEEVVVTAERVEKSAQDTPIAMSVYSGEDLANAGLNNIKDLANYDPSIQLNGTLNTAFTIRGVRSNDDTEVGDPAVPVAYENFYSNRPVFQHGATYDLERVEVLRGPQGTLYGRNAVGGLINVTVAKPEGEFGAKGSLEVGNFNALNFEGMINVPVSDKLWLRGAYSSVSHEGFRKQEPVGGRADDADSQSARLSLLYMPTDKLTVYLMAQNTTIDQTLPTRQQFRATFWHADGVTPGSPVCVLDGCELDHLPVNIKDSDTVHSYQTGFEKTEMQDLRARVTYSLDSGMQLEYLFGWQDMRQEAAVSPGGLRIDLGRSSRTFNPLQEPRTTNHELRIISNQDRDFFWQGGVFFFEEQSFVYTQEWNNYGNNLQTRNELYDYPDLNQQSKAVFLQAGYRFLENFVFSLGGRYTEDEKRRGDGDYVDDTNTAIPQPHLSSKSNATTWHVGLDWNLSDLSLVYAKADRGYKAGGYTLTSVYEPEYLTAYEVGYKTSFHDRVRLNVSAFFNDYTGQQISQQREESVGVVIDNAGKSEIKGLDLEIDALVSDYTRVKFFAAYLDSEYKDFSTINTRETCPIPGVNPVPHERPACNVQLAGNRTPMTPEQSYSLSLEQTLPLSRGDLIASAGARYRGKVNFSEWNYADLEVDSHVIADASVKWVPQASNWDLMLFVRNLTDETYPVNLLEHPFGYVDAWFSDPRTFGLRFSAYTK